MKKRLVAIWLAGLGLVGAELVGLMLVREFAARPANVAPVTEQAIEAAGGRELTKPLRDVLLFPLI